jgi:hypothetical protein
MHSETDREKSHRLSECEKKEHTRQIDNIALQWNNGGQTGLCMIFSLQEC